MLIIMNVIHYQVFGSFIYDAIEVTYVMNAQIICVFEKLSQPFLIFSINGSIQNRQTVCENRNNKTFK